MTSSSPNPSNIFSFKQLNKMKNGMGVAQTVMNTLYIRVET